MAWVDDWLMAVSLIAVLGCASAIVAWLLRRSGAPGGVQGAAVCAGVFVGLLAGPGVAANAWPDWYARWVVGGAQEARDLADLRTQQREESAALRATGVTPVAIEELESRHGAELQPLEAALTRARDERRAWNDRGLLAVGAMAVGLGVLCARRPFVIAGRRGVGAGGATFALGVGLPWAGMWLLGVPFAGALSLSVGAIGAGVGLVGVALGASGVAMLASACAAAVVFGAAVVPAAAGGLAGAVGRALTPSSAVRRVRRRALDFLWVLAMPALGALVAIRLDLRALDASSWGLWLILVFALIWCSDGRMGAAWIGLKLFGAERPWSRSARMVNSGATVAHLVLAALGAAAGALPQTALTACVASAVLLALTVGARRMIAAMIEAGGLSP